MHIVKYKAQAGHVILNFSIRVYTVYVFTGASGCLSDTLHARYFRRVSSFSDSVITCENAD